MSTSNMHLFNEKEKLKKYDTVEEIIEDYFDTRLDLYDDRRDYLIEIYEKELIILENKMKYISELLNDTIDLRKKNKQQVIQMLHDKKYHQPEDDDDFKYLTKMHMDSVTQENVDSLEKHLTTKKSDLEKIKSTTIEQMWLSELSELEQEYTKYSSERRALDSDPSPKKSVVTKKK